MDEGTATYNIHLNSGKASDTVLHDNTVPKLGTMDLIVVEHPVSKELAGWSQAKRRSQWLSVHGEWNKSHSSQEILGPAWPKVFIGNMDGGIKCTFSKFVNNTKQCGAGDTQEGRNAFQKGLDRLEKRTCANHMKLNKAKH